MTPARPHPALHRALVRVAPAALLLGLLVGQPATASAAGPVASTPPTPTSGPSTSAAPTPHPSPTAHPTPTSSPAQTQTQSASPRPMASPSPTGSLTPTPTPGAAEPLGAGLAAAAPPVLAVTLTVSPVPVTVAGQTVTHTVAVRNTGGSALAGLVVTAVAANLHALTCTPVAQGGTLAAGGTTTCTGTRTSTAEDLRTHGGTVRGTAAGFAPDGRAVTGTTTARLVVATAPPSATDDAAVTTPGVPVVLPASTDDGPAGAGGPAIDPGRTLFKQRYHPEANPDTKYTESSNGEWFVRADGSVLFVPRAGRTTGGTDTVPYRVFDSAGQSSVADLTVTVRPGAQAVADGVTTSQGAEALVSPLANDRAGQALDGRPAALVDDSIRFPDAQPVPNAVVSLGGTRLDLPFVGTLDTYAGQVELRPDRSFRGTVAVAYSVTDSVGNIASATITFTVTPQVPTARDLTVPLGYDVDPGLALFTWSSIDTGPTTGVPVSFEGFTGPDGAPLGTAVDASQGRWSFSSTVDGPQYVGFDAAPGFAGTASIGYTLVDFNGTRATARFSVTVPAGPRTRPDLLLSRRGADATVDPAADDTPGARADGRPGSFAARYAVFPTDGQPAGSVVSDRGKTLTVSGRGRLWFSGGRVTFRPQAGFSGDGGSVTYQVEDTGPSLFVRGRSVTGTLRLVVTADRPVPTDDAAATTYGRTVTLPGSTDDDPGSVPGPLTTTFPTVGQPVGSVVTTGGRALSVPDEGVWTVLTSGAVTFTPTTGFVGGASDVRYRITRTDGASATAVLRVSVAPGISARPVAVVRAQGPDAVVDPLVGTRPGSGADGTMGALEPLSVRFPTTGQPVDARVSGDGKGLSFARGGASSGFSFTVDGAGLVHAVVPPGYRGATPRVRFTVQGTVVDAVGVTVRQQAASTLVVTVEGRAPVAVDDHLVVPAIHGYLTLPGPRNDVPASASLPLDLEGTSFPYDQLAALPKGSVIKFLPEQNSESWYASVPGEGFWTVGYFSSGQVAFQPDEGFTGTTSPLRYRASDAVGNTVEGVLTVTVLKGAVLRDDTASTLQGVSVGVDVARNDTPGLAAGGGAAEPDPAGASFPSGSEQPPGSTVSLDSYGRTLVVPGEGTYSLGYGATTVLFTPVKGFRGTTTPVYVGREGDEAALKIRVAGVDPVARDDTATTTRGVPVRIRLLDDDEPGSPSRSLVTSSVRLTPAGLPAGATVSADGQTLSVPGRGTFAAAGDGTVTFYPRAGVTGTVPTVGYRVSDVNGTAAQARVAVLVT